MLTNGRTLFDRSSVTDQIDATTPPTNKLAIIVQQGRYSTSLMATPRGVKPRRNTSDRIAKSLVREYRYDKASISVEFTLRLGSRKPRAPSLA